jgi:Sec-independent protein secretion pathway component TatC
MARIRRVRPDGELPVRLFACTAAFTVAAAFGVVVPWALHSLTTFDSHEVHYLPRASDYLHFVMGTLLATGIAFELPGLMLLRKES